MIPFSMILRDPCLHFKVTILFTADNGGGKCDCPRCLSDCLSVCLSVCLLARLLKRVHRFRWHFACRQMSGHGRTYQLLSAIRIIVRMPEPDCFLRYRMRTATRNFVTSRKSHGHGYWAPVAATELNIERSRSSDAWFWGVETPLSEINALYRVHF